MDEEHSDHFKDSYKERLESLKKSSNLETKEKERERGEKSQFLPIDNFEPEKSKGNNTEIRPPPIDGDEDGDDENEDYEIKYRGLYSASSSSEEEDDDEDEDDEEEENGEYYSVKNDIEEFVNDQKRREEEEEEEEDGIGFQEKLEREEEKEAMLMQENRLKRLASSDFESELLDTFKEKENEEKVDESESNEGKDGDQQFVVTNKIDEKGELSFPEINPFIEILKSNCSSILDELMPILRKINKKKEFLTIEGNKYLKLKYHVLYIYTVNILFYFGLLSNRSAIDGENAVKYVRNHPVVDRIAELRALLEKVEAKVETEEFKSDFGLIKKIFEEEKLKKKTKKISVEASKKENENLENVRVKENEKGKDKEDESEMLQNFESLGDIFGKEVPQKIKKKRGKKRKRREKKDVNPRPKKISKLERRIEENKMYENPNSMLVRKVSDKIIQSKGLRDRSKEFLHPRIKHRDRFANKTREKRDMDNRFKREKGGLYKGENDINKNVIRSRKIR